MSTSEHALRQASKTHRYSSVSGWAMALAFAALVRVLTMGLYPLMDTTEARYAEIARKMVELGDWVTPWFDYGVPFWGKPPLSFWLTAGSFELFGVGEFAARLPHLLCALLVAWMVWDLARRRGRQEARLAVGLLTGSVLFFVAAAAVMTDMALAAATTLAMRGFWLGLYGSAKERRYERWLLFVGLGLGLLAKGPIAVVLAGLPIGLWSLATGNLLLLWRRLPWIRGTLLMLAIALPWYALAELRTPGFLEYFLVGEHWRRFVTPGWNGDLYGNAHEHPYGTIWWFAFLATFPWSLLLPIAALRWRKALRPAGAASPRDDRGYRWYLLLWGLTPCLFFTAAGNVIWTYVLPGLPALGLWAASWLAGPASGNTSLRRTLIAGLVATPLCFAGFVAYLHASGRTELKSAKALVGAYEARRADTPAALFFVDDRPYSAMFYSGGRAREIADVGRLLSDGLRPGAFYAIEAERLPRLPDALRARLEPLSRFGEYWLCRGRALGSERVSSVVNRIRRDN